MGKVKTQPARIHIGTCLLYMVSQYLAQSLLKQMGGAVVLACKSAVVGADRQCHGFPYLEHAFCHDSHMAYLAALKMYGILYLKGAVFIGNNACISLLAAHGSVKRGPLHDDGTLLSVRKGLYQLCLLYTSSSGRIFTFW